MNVVPLSDRGPSAIRDALLSHGWEGDLSRLAAGGLANAAFLVTGATADTIEAMLLVAPRLGLELVTGDTWLILAGARSRLGAFARPWLQPDAVRDLATAVGMAMPPEPARAWRCMGRSVALEHPVVVGILNVTPDSFSDGGTTLTPDAALRHVDLLLDGGAAMIDIGGESTRPGAHALHGDDERARMLPVLAAVAARHPTVPLSVDTVRGDTARAALDAGASVINDVTGGRHDPSLLDVVASRGAGVVLVHSRGVLGELASYHHADYGNDVTSAVATELAGAIHAATAAGVASDAVVIDPGFGFGKRPAQNLTLLAQLDAIAALGPPVLVGVSRKRFLGDVTGRPVDDRDRATAAACALALDRGARLFRVHDPATVHDALAVSAAVAGVGR